jgi:monoamine oxidase
VNVTGASPGGARVEIAADRVVCAIPFPMLRRLDVTPALSDDKRRWLEGVPYDSAMQVFVQLRERPWEREGLNGFAVTDTFGEIWHATHALPGPRAIVVAYAKGPMARRLMALDAEARVRAAVDAIEQVHPGTRDVVETAVVTCWDEEPWARGAQARPWDLPGATSREVRRAEGRIHFAGEHTAEAAPGWMEGAIESGIRAADDVCLAGR